MPATSDLREDLFARVPAHFDIKEDHIREPRFDLAIELVWRRHGPDFVPLSGQDFSQVLEEILIVIERQDGQRRHGVGRISGD